MTPYTTMLVGLLCRLSVPQTPQSLRIILERILPTMSDPSTCGFRPTPLPMTPFVFCYSNALSLEMLQWYVDYPTASHSISAMLAKAFLSYFQLPLRYDTDTGLLTPFLQSSVTRLSDHVQEWHRRRSTCHATQFEDRDYLN